MVWYGPDQRWWWMVAVKAAESAVGGVGSDVKNRRWKFAELPDEVNCWSFYRVLTNAGMLRKGLDRLWNSDWIKLSLQLPETEIWKFEFLFWSTGLLEFDFYLQSSSHPYQDQFPSNPATNRQWISSKKIWNQRCSVKKINSELGNSFAEFT